MKIWRLKKAIFIYHLFLAYLNSFPGPLLTKHEDSNIEYRMLPSPMNTISIKTVFYGISCFHQARYACKCSCEPHAFKTSNGLSQGPLLNNPDPDFFSFYIRQMYCPAN